MCADQDQGQDDVFHHNNLGAVCFLINIYYIKHFLFVMCVCVCSFFFQNLPLDGAKLYTLAI